MRSDWEWNSVWDLQTAGILRVEDGNHGENRPRPDEFVPDGTVFIRAADLGDGTVHFNSASRISDRALARIRKGIGAPLDVLFSHKGTVGKVALVRSNAPPFVCSPQTTFWRSVDRSRLDQRFLYAYMRSSDFKKQWSLRKGESDMADYVSLTAQRELLVPLPSLDVQRRIAGVLAAYDELIENNRRQVAIVEAMAKVIYRQWFMEFRYPGHEKSHPLTDASTGKVPEGWELVRLGDRIELSYGRALKETDRHEGQVPVFGSSGTTRLWLKGQGSLSAGRVTLAVCTGHTAISTLLTQHSS
jgi:restriction endonuclease S subunit